MSSHPRADDFDMADVLSALGNPLRLLIVRRLADGGERSCGSLVEGVPPSTMTRHWRVLRDAGIIWQKPAGRENLLSLRRADLDRRFPGLLDAIIDSSASASDALPKQ